MILDSERYHHCRMVFGYNYGGVDNDKAIIHDKRRSVYINEKNALIECGYSVEVSGSDGKKGL